ncbi:MAG: alpha/beta hydrolase [Prolixibacteraceae bacterium]|nr:alpha/beta hydrolase [Prolixibacteraceae bacterium]
MMRFFLSVLLLSGVLFCWGQQQKTFPLDTSFSLHSAWQKELKHYPFIKPVYPLVPDAVEVKRDLVYATYAGREMHMDVFAPKGLEEARPAILFIHGGGWKSGNRNMEAPMAIHFASLGYITVTVEYRLSPEALYPAALYDIKTALRWIRKNAGILHLDPDRIVISGTSAGGQLAALVAATNGSALFIDTTYYPEFSSKVQAVVNIDGILAFIHPESGEGADRPGKPSAATFWFGGNQEEKIALWLEASALNHVDQNMPPILFINSQHPRFHAGRNNMIEVLDSLNIYSEVYEIPETPHTFWLFEPWFTPTVKWMEPFLDKVLHSTPKPQPPPIPIGSQPQPQSQP